MKKSIATIALVALLTIGVAPAVQAFELPTLCPKGTHEVGRFCVADKPDTRYVAPAKRVAQHRAHLAQR